MPKGRGLRAAQAEATRQLLIDAAHRLFTEKGFHATTTLEIVTLAGVTRGALQHHFSSKEDLFQAVFEQEATYLATSTAEQIAIDGWQGFVAGLGNFLRNVDGYESQRINFVDGPAVLGWAEWRKLHIDHSLKMIETAISDGISTGAISPQPTRALAYLIRSVIEEAALMTINADELQIIPEDVEHALMTLLFSLNPIRTASSKRGNRSHDQMARHIDDAADGRRRPG